MREHRAEWRELTGAEKRKYAVAMRRLNLGIWGYALSTLRAVHLTTKEGNDNTPGVFARDLRKLVGSFRDDGYDLQYNGALEFSPEKNLLHWHGIFRIKGGFFLKPMISWKDKAAVRRELGHILKEYIGVDENIRNKFLFSRGWMREGWKKIEDLAKLWVLGGYESDGGMTPMLMEKEKWNKVNEIVQAWAEKKTVLFPGENIDGEVSGYLYMELGRIREAFGSGSIIWRNGVVCPSRFEYLDF